MVGFDTSDGTALAGVDYSAASGTLNWTAGDLSVRKILVAVNASAAGKLFDVNLLPLGGGAALSGPASAVVSITAASVVAPPAATTQCQ
jgi:hypothetical protein